MCKAVSYLQGVAVSASINTLVAVSADRYVFFICNPFCPTFASFSLQRLTAVPRERSHDP